MFDITQGVPKQHLDYLESIFLLRLQIIKNQASDYAQFCLYANELMAIMPGPSVRHWIYKFQ